MSVCSERIRAIQHILAGIFAAQRALRELAPEFNWSGLGNLLGDFGELVAIEHYGLVKAPGGSDGYDATTKDGKRVQIKTNYAADQIGFRGSADLMLVIGVRNDGTWQELYFGSFDEVRKIARFSARDNKHMVPISKLPKPNPTATLTPVVATKAVVAKQ
jgi:hypothetical protein